MEKSKEIVANYGKAEQKADADKDKAEQKELARQAKEASKKKKVNLFEDDIKQNK